MWIPFFVISAILEDGIAQFESKQGLYFSIPDFQQSNLNLEVDKRWSMGVVFSCKKY